MEGVQHDQAGWTTRIIYWFAKRAIGKLTGDSRLVAPVKILAHHPTLLKAQGRMEMGQQAARSADASLKALVSIKTSMLIGCPF
jgi:hypothetical protein